MNRETMPEEPLRPTNHPADPATAPPPLVVGDPSLLASSDRSQRRDDEKHITLPPGVERPARHDHHSSDTSEPPPVGDSRVSLLRRQVDSVMVGLVVTAVATAIIAALGIYLAITVGGLQSRLNNQQSQQAAVNTEWARADNVTRSAVCQAVQAIRSTFSTAGRDAFPGGGGRYDDLYAQFAGAADKLHCDSE